MRQFDLIIWGATGFTGRLVCEHLLRQYNGNLCWAAAGRNMKKLEELRETLGSEAVRAKDVPLLTANLSNEAAMLKLAGSTKVLLSTAGPYLYLGHPVIRACLKARTHYADINGEIEWMRQTIQEFHEPALAAGVKIVHCCGWDCAPADLGVLFLAQHAESHLNRKLSKVTNLVTELAGAFSGGSLNTALGFYKEPLKSLFPHPYSLNPPLHRNGADKQQFMGPWYEPITGLYTSPSFFAPADMRIVRRSNHLLGSVYGSTFMFDEAFGHKSVWKAVAETVSLWLMGLFLLVVARVPLLANLLKARSLKPGEGPSRKFMEEGSWRCELVGLTEEADAKPQTILAVLQGKGDPGYLQTSRMLLEAGMCLLHNESSPFCLKGGVLTPASALGMPLIERLKAAGISFKILNGKTTSFAAKTK